MIDKKILELSEKTLERYQLCDSCLGRLFRQIQKGTTNKQKGELIRNNLKQSKKTETKNKTTIHLSNMQLESTLHH